MTTRVISSSEVPYPDEPGWPEWDTWLRRHGLDPSEMPKYGGPIICDDVLRTVEATTLWLEETTKRTVVNRDNTVRTQRTRIQLEAPALPFPTIYSTRWNGHDWQ